jgi:Arc/MetJ family transcription regulator
MRTNIEIDDSLLREAMQATNSVTKRAAVEACLRRVVQLKKQEGIRELFGKIQWEGNLDALRESRVAEPDEGAISSVSLSLARDAAVERESFKSR